MCVSYSSELISNPDCVKRHGIHQQRQYSHLHKKRVEVESLSVKAQPKFCYLNSESFFKPGLCFENKDNDLDRP